MNGENNAERLMMNEKMPFNIKHSPFIIKTQSVRNVKGLGVVAKTQRKP